MRRLLAAFLVIALGAAPAGAAFDEAPNSARAAAMAGAMTAVIDDPVAVLSNPATIGQIRRPGVGLNYLRQFDAASGKVDQDRFGFASAIPVAQELINGSFGLSYVYNRQRAKAVERAAVFSYASRSMVQTESGALDLGASVKLLGRSLDGGGSASHGTLDLGGLWRFGERYAAGVSILNVTRPGFVNPGGQRDRAPAALKLGFSETVRGFVLALDLTKSERTAGNTGSMSLAGGLERWWATARSGSFAIRAGLGLGDRSKVAASGLAWRVLGGEAAYAITIPMMGPTVCGHAVSLSFRFGVSNPEQEYERVLSDEIRYRRELTQALESAEAKQWRLGEELGRLREELELLRSQLTDKTASESQARQRIHDLEIRRKDAEQRFESLREEQKRLAERSVQSLFDEDWNSYLKVKLGGAPDALLVDQVKRILRQYKDKGVDVSAANVELVRLLRAK